MIKCPYRVIHICIQLVELCTDRRKTPPRSEAFRHSGDDKRRCTSATVTLYLDVELSRDRRPGTEQKRSPGARPGPSMLATSGQASTEPPPDCYRRSNSRIYYILTIYICIFMHIYNKFIMTVTTASRKAHSESLNQMKLKII